MRPDMCVSEHCTACHQRTWSAHDDVDATTQRALLHTVNDVQLHNTPRTRIQCTQVRKDHHNKRTCAPYGVPPYMATVDTLRAHDSNSFTICAWRQHSTVDATHNLACTTTTHTYRTCLASSRVGHMTSTRGGAPYARGPFAIATHTAVTNRHVCDTW
jgi:hypothetical protein